MLVLLQKLLLLFRKDSSSTNGDLCFITSVICALPHVTGGPHPCRAVKILRLSGPTVFLVKETIARRWRMNLNKAGVKVPVVLR